jgi:hypothetical protein
MSRAASRGAGRAIGLAFVACFLTAFLPVVSIALVTFEKTFGGAADDKGRAVVQTPDKGYMIAGHTKSFGAGGYDVYLIKTDSTGNALWTATFGDSLDENCYSVLQMPDKGYMLAGLTNSCGAGLSDVYAIRTDSLGGSVWERTWGGTNYDAAYSAHEVEGGNCLIGGNTLSFGHGGGYDGYLIKISPAGETLWTRAYGSSGSEQGCSIDQTPGGQYVLAGYYFGGNGNVWLVETSNSGDSLWARWYGSLTGPEFGRSVVCTTDGGFVIAGYAMLPLNDSGDTYVIRTSSTGDSLWAYAYGGSGDDGAWQVVEVPGGYTIAGLTSSLGAGGYDLLLLKINTNGGLTWSRTYGGSLYDAGYSVCRTTDGGYIITGETRSCGAGGADVYLIKTDGNGLVDSVNDGATVSLDSPPDTVFCDSTYQVLATVRNLGNVCLTFDVIATIDGYADTIHGTGLSSGCSLQVAFDNWTVPSADSTSYTMTVCTHVLEDADSTNDCAQKSIFAYQAVGVTEQRRRKAESGRMQLSSNDPNPFSQSTVIRYFLPGTGHVSIRIYDMAGRIVETLVDGTAQPGIHEVVWEAKEQKSGIYFCRLETDGQTDVKKMTLVR